MNKPMTLACLLAMTTAAMAETTFDQDVSPNVIFGSGNANGGFTVDRDNGIELALRGKLRHDATGEPQNRWNSNGDGTYTFRAGVAPGQSFPTAEWSFEWSVNTNYDDSTSYDLSDLSYLLLIDTDPTTGTNFVVFDPINGSNYYDHAIGDNYTGNGEGTVVDKNASDRDTQYANLIAANNVAQNSWKPHWFVDDFNPNALGEYDILLSAKNQDGLLLASTGITINVVPLPAAAWPAMTLLGLIGADRFRRRQRDRVQA